MDELFGSRSEMLGGEQIAWAIGALIGGFLTVQKVIGGMKARSNAEKSRDTYSNDVDFQGLHDHLIRIEKAIRDQDVRIARNTRRLDSVCGKVWGIERHIASGENPDRPMPDNTD